MLKNCKAREKRLARAPIEERMGGRYQAWKAMQSEVSGKKKGKEDKGLVCSRKRGVQRGRRSRGKRMRKSKS